MLFIAIYFWLVACILPNATLVKTHESQVADFVGREELVDRAMAAITAPTVVPGAGTNSNSIVDGSKIEVNYYGSDIWYPGIVSRSNGDGTFDIIYDDGDQETAVVEGRIRLSDDDRVSNNFR